MKNGWWPKRNSISVVGSQQKGRESSHSWSFLLQFDLNKKKEGKNTINMRICHIDKSYKIFFMFACICRVQITIITYQIWMEEKASRSLFHLPRKNLTDFRLELFFIMPMQIYNPFITSPWFRCLAIFVFISIYFGLHENCNESNLIIRFTCL